MPEQAGAAADDVVALAANADDVVGDLPFLSVTACALTRATLMSPTRFHWPNWPGAGS